MERPDPTQFIATTAPIPGIPEVLDPEHPDAEILEAHANIRVLRAFSYAHDGRLAEADESDEAVQLDARMAEHEKSITGNWATTPAGVSARLQLMLPEITQERWVDRGLAEHGLFALYKVRESLEFAECQVVEAAFELLHVEWETALAAYDTARAYSDQLWTIGVLVDAELSGLQEVGRTPSNTVSKIKEYLGRLQVEHSTAPAFTRLVRTLTPDLAAYRRKVEILAREPLTDAAQWLGRDAAFLFETIERGSPIVPPQAS